MASSDSTESLPKDSGGGLGSPEPIPSDSSDPPILPGSCLGRYTVVAELGRGGMGRVFTAYDPDLRRVIALKVLRPGLADASPGAVLRLQREAQAMARLNHPNVVSVYDVGMVDGRVFVAMELVEGPTLAAWLAERPRGWREIRNVFREAGRGLAAAHAAGLVHRDFKPSNVLLGDRARVADFGLARAANEIDAPTSEMALLDGAHVTETGAAVGTPAYMAPEQRQGSEVDAQADQYSFCVALWEALHSERSTSSQRTWAKARSEVPGRIDDAVQRGLSSDPAGRWPSMNALLDALAYEPATTRRRYAIGVSVVALGAAAAWGLVRPAGADPCAGAAARLAGVWDGPRREAVRTAFLSTRLPDAAQNWRVASTGLDDYAARLTAMNVETCRATRVEGRQSDALMDARMMCLDGRRAVLARLIDLWLGGVDQKALEAAVEAAHRLPPLADCGDVRSLPERTPLPDDADRRARIAAIQARLDAADALIVARRLPDAQVLVATVRPAADATGWAPLRARAAYLDGVVRYHLQDPSAERPLLEALSLASEAHDDRLAARIALDLVESIAEDGRRAMRAFAVADMAEAVLARVGADIELRARLLRGRGEAFMTADRFAEARGAFSASYVSFAATYGPGDLETLAEASRLARVARNLGDYAGARRRYEDVLAALTAAVGPEHSRVAVVLNNLGTLQEKMHDLEGAVASYRRALAIKERVFGPRSASAALVLSNIGFLEAELDHLDDAEATLEKALAIREEVLGREHPYVGITLGFLALVREKQGRFAEALALEERGLEIARRANGDDDEEVAGHLSGLGDILAAMGDDTGALEKHRQSLALEEKLHGSRHEDTINETRRVAASLVRLGRCREARPLLAAIRVALEDTLGAVHPTLAAALGLEASCDLSERHAAAALEAAERALALAEKTKMPAVERGAIRFLLARATWALGRHPTAWAAADLAERELGADFDGARERAAVRAWLDSHR